MMGEYIIYYQGRIAGAKEMLLVEYVDSKNYLAGLFTVMYDELPVHKSNNKIMKF